MFTGIVQGQGKLEEVTELPGLKKLTVKLPVDADQELKIGASIAVDGVCLTVNNINKNLVGFDVMQETLAKTTLGKLEVNNFVNIERSSKGNTEIGGHILSGHIDGTAKIESIDTPQNNYIITFKIPKEFQRYIFEKGYIALNGASLTITAVNKNENTFKVWLIPETLRVTTFANKKVGDLVNLEVDKNTQIIVDTVQNWLEEHAGDVA